MRYPPVASCRCPRSTVCSRQCFVSAWPPYVMPTRVTPSRTAAASMVAGGDVDRQLWNRAPKAQRKRGKRSDNSYCTCSACCYKLVTSRGPQTGFPNESSARTRWRFTIASERCAPPPCEGSWFGTGRTSRIGSSVSGSLKSTNWSDCRPRSPKKASSVDGRVEWVF